MRMVSQVFRRGTLARTIKILSNMRKKKICFCAREFYAVKSDHCFIQIATFSIITCKSYYYILHKQTPERVLFEKSCESEYDLVIFIQMAKVTHNFQICPYVKHVEYLLYLDETLKKMKQFTIGLSRFF